MNSLLDFQYQVSRIEKHLGIDISKKTSGIKLGKDESFLPQEIIKNWIAVIYDLVKKARRIHQESDKPNEDQKKLLKYRLFSFSEYKNLFISYSSNKELRSLAASQFLGIKRPTDANRILFGLLPNEQDYQLLLRKFSPKIPKTNFLLVDFLKANFQNNAHVSINELKKGAAIIAGSGSGKTTLLSSVLHSLMEVSPSDSFVIIDPHGHLTDTISKFKFDDRQMFFSLKHFNRNQSIFSLNVLDFEISNDNELGHAVDNIVDAISELPTLDGHTVSENMYSVLTYCIKFLLLKVEKPTLLDLFNLLNKEETILKDAQNFNPYFGKRFLNTEASSRDAARRRVENAIKNEVMREILCSESSFNFEKAINGNKILLFDLSSLSSYASIAFGKFLIAVIKNLVRTRGANTELVTYLAIDEAPVFVGKGKNYEDILSQKRKFGLHTILSAQYANQFGNALETVKYNTSVKVIAGENPKDFSNFISIPNSLLKQDINGRPINLLALKPYQFVLSNKNQNPIKFQADDKVIFRNDIFHSEEDHNIFLAEQFRTLYKPYKQKSKQEEYKLLSLEKVKLSGNRIEPKPINLGKGDKKMKMLYALAKFKFLTIDQLLRLGISKFQSGLPNSELEKAGFIASVFVLLDSKVKVFFLTKKGAKYVDSNIGGLLKINYPTSKVTKLNTIDHIYTVVNHQIAIERYHPEFVYKDIDNSSIRNVRATRISWNGKKIEPDLVFAIQDNWFTLEIERLKDSKKSFRKIVQHIDMIESQAYQRQYGFLKEHRSLWVFEEEGTMKSVMQKCRELESFHIENFLFKLKDHDVYNGWKNVNKQDRSLIYV